MALCLFACKSEPKSTDDLIKECINNKVNNCKIKGNIDIDVQTEYEGQKYDMPIAMTVDMDCTEKVSHGNMDMNLEFFGQKQSQSSEVYVDVPNKVTYTKMDGSWKKTENESSISDMSSADSLKTLKDFKFAKTKNGYTLTGSLKDMESSGIFDSLNLDSLKNVKMEGGDFIYSFNKDYQITNIKMDEVKMSVDQEGTKGTVTMNMNLDVSDYGKIQDIEIPKEALDA